MARPLVITIAGPPCSGKSTLAGCLASTLGAVRLEMDRFRLRLLPDSRHSVEDRDIAYRAMHLTTEIVARQSAHVVVDATYTAASCRAGLIEAVERVNAVMFLIECHVDAALAVRRFRQRGPHAAADLTESRVAALAAEYPYFALAYPVVWSPDRDLDVGQVVRRLGQRPLDRAARERWSASGLTRERPIRHAVFKC
jgi:predicted kinase